MSVPDIAAFRRLSRRGNTIALTVTVPADLETPVSAFLKLVPAQDGFLLESAEQNERIGRYSILGLSPETALVIRDGSVFLREKEGREKLYGEDVVESLQRFMEGFRLANPEAVPGFSGGLVGYLGYENVQHFEDVRLAPKAGLKVPDGVFVLARDFLIFDHFKKQLTLVHLARAGRGASAAREYRQGLKRIERHLSALRRSLGARAVPRRPQPFPFELVSNMSRADFEGKVRRIKEYIRAGDCIQAVLSQRFRLVSRRPSDGFKIYRALRSVNPSPYMFYFRFGELRLIGASPELLVKKTGRTVQVSPIAGTRPRGRTPEEDLRLEDNLRKSPKEMAEHVMLVDLGRNDLGRVCRYETVKVDRYARVERYSHVMHLVSDVTAVLKPRKNAFDLLKAVFPAGTLTGAPKIRAMQIIDELENERRGPYGGCVGYFGFNGDLDMCITIRTLTASGKNIFLQAGAGIVKDSEPGREYLETVNKARALMKAVAEQGRF
jgi:anthranilate synthase component 1